MRWPEPEGRKKIPIGHYEFRLNREPELIAFEYSDPQTGEKKSGRKIKLYAVGLNDTGNYSIIDQIPVWDERYTTLCEALKVEHGRDIEMEGAVFDADVTYEADKKDPTKSYPRLANITAHDDVPSSKGIAEDIPFD